MGFDAEMAFKPLPSSTSRDISADADQSRLLQYPPTVSVYINEAMTAEERERIAVVVKREESRLRNFIRSRVADPLDAEDILQDVFAELVEANQLLMPIEHMSGWLFRVARNRIIDLFRRKKPESLEFEGLLPSPDAGPDAELARGMLLEALEAAIAELPKEQRDVFVAHELEGRSFKEMADESGVSINTLLSRKRYALLHLRERLRTIHDDLDQ